VAKQDITIETKDGKAKAGVFTPAMPQVGKKAGVIYYMDAFGPRAATDQLAERLAAAAEIDHTIENYVGKQHGWAVPDHGVFDAAGAERHWNRLLVFFAEAL